MTRALMSEIDPDRYIRSLKARRLRGAAAVTEMLDLIGATGVDDTDIGHVFVRHELEIRELVAFCLAKLCEPDES